MNHPRAIKFDIEDTQVVDAVIAKTKPDVIVHAAGITKPDICERDPELSYRVNVHGTANVIAAAKRHNTRLIFLSSDLVFDGMKTEPYAEHDSVNPTTVYGIHKVAVEEMIRKELKNYVIIRSSMMYGWTPPHINGFAEWVVSSLSQGKPVMMFSDQRRNLTFVGDMADFICQMLESSVVSTVHFASPECKSKFDFGLEVAKVFGYDVELVKPTSSSMLKRIASVPLLVSLDVAQATELQRAVPNNLSNGVKQLFTQFLDDYQAQIRSWW